MSRNSKAILGASLALILCAGATVAEAGKGKGSGGPGDGGSGGITPATITFRNAGDDRIRSDGGPYVDGVEGVEAFLGSKANYGNVWLRLANSSRGLTLDFAECVSGDCQPLFTSDTVGMSAIKIDADNVQADGLFGMAVGTTIYAPMRVYYEFDDGAGPGFVDFNPTLSGKTPCKNKSNHVTVTRTGDKTWDVSADRTVTACVTLPGGTDLAGVFLMPFQLTVESQ